VSNVDLAALAAALQRVVAACDIGKRLNSDPVGLVHEVQGPENQEIAALLASCLAFGNVASLRASIRAVLERLGPEPASALDDAVEARARLRGVKHRMLRDDDITRLLIGARKMQRRWGSLGARFSFLLERHGALREALIAWTAELREDAGLRPHPVRRGPAHILADPSKNSSCKRLLLLLRWMVRSDQVDLGLWSSVSPSVLLVPVDTHIHRLARNLGLTACPGPSWTAAEQITSVLREIDPHDPVRFDFALCHMGMLQGCPSRRDPAACEGCGVHSVCRHWGSRRSSSR
jgi:uncharacterized protein (TIGR02757 family)